MSDDYKRFLELRWKVLKVIGRNLDGGHKSYEGAMEIIYCFPNYFEVEGEQDYISSVIIELHCYVLGPARHYRWEGKTLGKALDKCRIELRSWGLDV